MKIIIILMAILSLSGCGAKDEITSLSTFRDSEKVWVFAQFNVNEEENINSYYYYGKISKNLYEAISTNSIQTGFILMENVKYWGNGNIIYEYEDEQDAGELIFRIENIVKVDLLKKAPATGKPIEESDGKVEETTNLEKEDDKEEDVLTNVSN